MKSGLIIFLLVFLVFALQQMPVFYRLFSDTQTELVMWLGDARKYRENKVLRKLHEDIESTFEGNNEAQVAYLEKVTKNTENLATFYRLYCVGADKNPFIYGAKLHYFCERIVKSGLIKV
ncbi:hypothetical protein [Alteromonas sp. a30]|uniref:hypothetical protein n=1 Tax=Alteromonas sp. a30 TaxID=2730917 RepID=UPI002281F82A|nr:hypothetical protein [Alteromonas sp. a30]MCY7294710.1 hypothetical protein [Alteromonas sp. a30]